MREQYLDRMDLERERGITIKAQAVRLAYELLGAVIGRVPPPEGCPDVPLRALIFDSAFDPYRGVIAYLRVDEGVLPSRSKVRLMAAKAESDAEEVGVFAPNATPVPELG